MLATAPAAFLMILQATSEYFRDREELEHSLLRIAQIAASEERNIIVGAKQVLLALASQPAVVALQQPACEEAFRNVFLGMRALENIAAFNLAGRPVCTVKKAPPGVTVASRDWFDEVLSGKEFVVSDLVVSAVTDRKVLVVSVPLLNQNGQLVGALSATIGSGWLNWLSQITGPEDLPFSALVDIGGRPLDADQSRPQDLAKLPPSEKVVEALRDEAHVFLSSGRDGVERAYAVSPLVVDKLYLLIGRDAFDYFGGARFDLLAGLIIPVVLWVGTLACIWICIQRLVFRWLSNLGRAAKAYGAGDFAARPRRIEQAPEEFGYLARTMVEMASAIERRTEDLEQALTDKRWLIREVHHRVKNNLQIVASLFNLQIHHLSDPNTRSVFIDAQRRLNALELVHRTLYEAKDLKEINLGFFLSKLATLLMKSLTSTRTGSRERVSLRHRFSDMWVNPDQAVPMGLLVTEVFTNSLKHAFPGDRSGTIEISLDVLPDASGRLVIKDDGVATESDTTGFGSQLINAFAQQLGGTIEVTFGQGMTLILNFPSLVKRDPP